MKRFYKLFFFVGFLTIAVTCMQSCANIGSISGGDKDSIPPVMIASKPLLLDTNFKDNKVILAFNEYFDLKNPSQEFISSPPFVKTPDFKIKKKFLQVKFPEDLKDSVTYVLNFGNAIADYNEGNIYKNFRFIFSTYSKIDSFSIGGNLKNAHDMSVPEKTLVMLFKDHSDSIPFKELSYYIGKVDTTGNFNIDHIGPGTYKVFALNDMNTNLKADDFEARAFLDSLIVPERIPLIKTDSLAAGTIIHDIHDNNLKDSLTRDTVIITLTYDNKPGNLRLYMFKEDNLDQRVLEFSRPSGNRMYMVFQLPVGPEFEFKPLNVGIPPENMLIESNYGRDSLICWINDPAAIKTDTIRVQLTLLKKDSTGIFTQSYDTLAFGFREKPTDDLRRKKPEQAKKVVKEYLKLEFLAKENKIDLNSNLFFQTPTPLLSTDTSKLKLYVIRDTMVLDPREQKLEKAFRLEKGLLYLKFKRPIAKKLWLQSLNFKGENWYSPAASDSNRIYHVRITDPGIAQMDTIKLKVHYDNDFFMEQIQELSDTAILPLTQQKILSRKRSQAGKIDLVLFKHQNTAIEVIPEDFTARGNWYTIRKNNAADSISILFDDKKITDRDTLTFSIRCFDHIGLNNDSVFFKETMRVIFREKEQFLVSYSRLVKEELRIAFNKRLSQLPEISPLNFTVNTNWSQMSRNADGDSLNIKITDPFVSDMDTLLFQITYQDTDRKGRINNFKDTARFISRQKKDVKAKIIEEKAVVEKPKNQNVSVPLPIDFNIESDSVNIRRKILVSDWQSNTKYLLKYDSLAFTDIYKLYNNEGRYEFATRGLDYYAKLFLNLQQTNPFDTVQLSKDSLSIDTVPTEKTKIPEAELKKYYGDGQLILQLLGNKLVVVRELYLSGDQEVKLEFLPPGKYSLRIIFDRNNNGKWDTGNYFKYTQPERVIMSEKLIELKSNFDTKIDWNVGEGFIKSFTTNE
jgi:hypothetical protein